MQENKDIYRKFCESRDDLPIFFYDWWLDAVCKSNNWGVAVVKPDNDVLAFMPYYIKNVFGFKLSILPRFTQFLGPWINYPNDLKKTNKPEFEKKIMNKLIDQLPESHYFEQNFHYSVKNWLPFYWKNYQQTTRYTYIIDDITFPKSIFSDFTAAKRKNINKALERVEVKYDLGSDEFYEHHKKTLEAQNSKISYSKDIFKRIYQACYSRDRGRIIYAEDKHGNIHSALFIVWSKYSAYDLISSIDPRYKSSESASLLVWEIIKFLSKKTFRFDFEGSMIESVERSFRQFGTDQKAYFRINKYNSRLYYIFRIMREKTRRD